MKRQSDIVRRNYGQETQQDPTAIGNPPSGEVFTGFYTNQLWVKYDTGVVKYFSSEAARDDFDVVLSAGQTVFLLSDTLEATDLVFVDGSLFYDYTGIGTTTLTTDYAISQGSKLVWSK